MPSPLQKKSTWQSHIRRGKLFQSLHPIPLLGLFHMTAVHLLTPEEEDKDGEKRASEGSGRRAELRKLAEQHTEARSHLFSLVRACQGVQNLS
mmetsp:Transcript_53901/g.88036  ORF Transcript_53901/g.88036 Transcript_53901/m.88036 type:complete len:93 (-) Transcript_53901:309-587(-)